MGAKFRWVVLADDMTGALDAAGRSSVAWGRVPVFSHLPGEWPHARGVVIDLNARHLPEVEAERRMMAAARQARHAGADFLYLKVDSTLRGPVASMIRGVLHGWGSACALVCPAFPEQGRTVEGGVLLVHGVPVSETAFAADPRHPVSSSRVRDALAGVPVPVFPLNLAAAREAKAALIERLHVQAGLWLADAETNADLSVLAKAGLAAGIRLFVGSAGLLAALAQEDSEPGIRARPLPVVKGAVMVVVGSRHPVTRTQTARLSAAELEGVEILDASTWPFRRGEEVKVVGELAESANARCARGDVAALVVVGGDTARALVERLGVSRLDVWGEVGPGIPWAEATLPDGRVLVWVSKAGGFGNEDTLIQVVARLRALGDHV